jgi:hypothetical protein
MREREYKSIFSFSDLDQIHVEHHKKKNVYSRYTLTKYLKATAIL